MVQDFIMVLHFTIDVKVFVRVEDFVIQVAYVQIVNFITMISYQNEYFIQSSLQDWWLTQSSKFSGQVTQLL